LKNFVTNFSSRKALFYILTFPGNSFGDFIGYVNQSGNEGFGDIYTALVFRNIPLVMDLIQYPPLFVW